MLNQIVDLSKLESGKMVFRMYSINPSLIVTSLLKDHRYSLEKKILNVKTSFPDKTNLVTCDQNKISRVMSSLLDNAVQHSPEKKTISIVVEDCIYPVNPSEQAIKISFLDQREERIPQQVIDDFATFINLERRKTGDKANGISLAIAFEIVKHHHGLMEVQNCDPKGVSYSFTLPLNQPILPRPYQ
jgi:K+-sensing histidine kinase KdpD